MSRGRATTCESQVLTLWAYSTATSNVKELTDIVAAAAGDSSLREHTWVLLSESPEGGWGIGGHANTNADIGAAARAALAS